MLRLVLCSLVCHAAGFIGYDGKAYSMPAPHHQHRNHSARRHRHAAHMLNPRHRRSNTVIRAAPPSTVRSLLWGSRGLRGGEGAQLTGPERALRALCAEKGWKNASEFNACRQEVETERCPLPNSSKHAGLHLVPGLLHNHSVERKHMANAFNKSWCDQWWANSTVAAAAATAHARHRVHFHSLKEEPAEGEDAEDFDCEQGVEKWKEGWSPEKKAYCCKEADPKFCEGGAANETAASPSAAFGPAPAPVQAPVAAPTTATVPSNISDLPWIGEATAFERGGEFDTTQCACMDSEGEYVCFSDDPDDNPPACWIGWRVVPLGGGRFTCWAERAPGLGLPEQGFSGPNAEHHDGDTWTGDFGMEYGPKSEGKTWQEMAMEACKHKTTRWCIRNGFHSQEGGAAQAQRPEEPEEKAQESGSNSWWLLLIAALLVAALVGGLCYFLSG